MTGSGKASLIFTLKLSPGIAILAVTGSVISLETSAVLKYACGRYPEEKGFFLPPSSSFRM